MTHDAVKFCPVCKDEQFQFTKIEAGKVFIGHQCNVFNPPRTVWWNYIGFHVDDPIPPAPHHMDETV